MTMGRVKWWVAVASALALVVASSACTQGMDECAACTVTCRGYMRTTVGPGGGCETPTGFCPPYCVPSCAEDDGGVPGLCYPGGTAGCPSPGVSPVCVHN